MTLMSCEVWGMGLIWISTTAPDSIYGHLQYRKHGSVSLARTKNTVQQHVVCCWLFEFRNRPSNCQILGRKTDWSWTLLERRRFMVSESCLNATESIPSFESRKVMTQLKRQTESLSAFVDSRHRKATVDVDEQWWTMNGKWWRWLQSTRWVWRAKKEERRCFWIAKSNKRKRESTSNSLQVSSQWQIERRRIMSCLSMWHFLITLIICHCNVIGFLPSITHHPLSATSIESSKSKVKLFATKTIFAPPLISTESKIKASPPLEIVYTTDTHTLEEWLKKHATRDKKSTEQNSTLVLGFDSETIPRASFLSYGRRSHNEKEGPATLQLATLNSCLVVHLTHCQQTNLKALQRTLEDRSILKAGALR